MKHFYVLAKGEFGSLTLYVECDRSTGRTFTVNAFGDRKPNCPWTFERCQDAVRRGVWREIDLAEVLALRVRHQLRHLDVDHGLVEPDPTKDVPATVAQLVW